MLVDFKWSKKSLWKSFEYFVYVFLVNFWKFILNHHNNKILKDTMDEILNALHF